MAKSKETKSSKKNVLISLPADLAEAIEQKRDATGVSISFVVERLLRRWLESGGSIDDLAVSYLQERGK